MEAANHELSMPNRETHVDLMVKPYSQSLGVVTTLQFCGPTGHESS